jgi:hypothetical protein
MELMHNEIPREFLSALPDGIKYLVRHGKDFLVVEMVTCPNGHSLMSESVKLTVKLPSQSAYKSETNWAIFLLTPSGEAIRNCLILCRHWDRLL